MSQSESLTAWLWNLSGALYLLAALLGVIWVFAPKNWLRGLARAAGLFAFSIQTAAIAARWQADGRLPVFGFAESFYCLLWAIVAAFMTIESFGHVRGLGIFISPLIVLSYFFSAGFTTLNLVEAKPAQDPVLSAHILLALISYAFFAISFLLGSMYLIQNRALKRKQLNRIFQTLPSIELLERWNAGAIAISFPLLSISLGLGAYSAIALHGQTWIHWLADPMVIAAFVLWVLAAAITALRYWKQVRGRRIADLTLVGFGIVVLSLVGAGFVRHGKTDATTNAERGVDGR